jgi:hypothetical protein
VAADRHGGFLRDSGPHHVAHRGPAQVVKHQPFEIRGRARRIPGLAEILDRLSAPMKHVLASGKLRIPEKGEVQLVFRLFDVVARGSGLLQRHPRCEAALDRRTYGFAPPSDSFLEAKKWSLRRTSSQVSRSEILRNMQSYCVCKALYCSNIEEIMSSLWHQKLDKMLDLYDSVGERIWLRLQQ